MPQMALCMVMMVNLSKILNGSMGSFGKALEFDGTKGQYVQVPINDTLQLREQFSIAFWVKRGDAQIREWNYMGDSRRTEVGYQFLDKVTTKPISGRRHPVGHKKPLRTIFNLKTGYTLQ